MLDYLIRPLKKEDLPSIHEMRSEEAVMEMLEATPTQTLEDCKILLEGLGQSKNCFVAEFELPDGSTELAGMVLLQIYPSLRRRHCAVMAITVRKDCQGQGIGKALMQKMLDFADTWLLLGRIELQVFANNEKAIALYEKMGFEKEGLMKRAVIQNGQYADEWMMARIKDFDF